MKLSEHQAQFTRDLGLVAIRFNRWPRYRLVFGEVQRTEYQQAEHVRNGVSWTMDSDHVRKLAADVLLWIDGEYQREDEAYRVVAEFWEGLSPLNYAGLMRWGKDAHHLGRDRELPAGATPVSA